MSQLTYQIPEIPESCFLSDVSPLQEEESEVLKPTRILVVDDDPLPREVLSLNLESHGFECDVAESGEDALEQLSNQCFDIVLTDLSMPGISGMDVLEWVTDCQPTVPVLLVTGLCELKTAVESMKLGAFDYITKPFQLKTVLDRVQNALEQRSRKVAQERARHDVSASLKMQSEVLDSVQRDLAVQRNAALEALICALDARAHETESHSVRVRAYTLRLAEKLALTDTQTDDLAQGALLHDIGMIGVSDTILLKKGELTETEWREVQKHPLIGPEIIGDMASLGGAIDVIRSHHERFDGTGYPSGLRGDEIPLVARIFAVVDTYDAITSDRPYRKARSSLAARREIARVAGSQLDPSIVEVLLRIPQSELDQVARSARFESEHEEDDSSIGRELEMVAAL